MQPARSSGLRSTLASSTGLPSSRRSKPSLQRRREPGNTLEGCSHARGVQQNQLGQHELLGASFELVFECANCGCLTFGDSTLFQNEIGRPLRRTSKATSVGETPLTAARSASLCVCISGELLSRRNRPPTTKKQFVPIQLPSIRGGQAASFKSLYLNRHSEKAPGTRAMRTS